MDEQQLKALIEQEIAEMVTSGALDVEFSDDGEVLFRVTPLTETLYPEFYKAHLEELDEELLHLLELDLITVTYNENLEAVFSLTEAGRRYVEEANGEGISTDPDSSDRGPGEGVVSP